MARDLVETVEGLVSVDDTLLKLDAKKVADFLPAPVVGGVIARSVAALGESPARAPSS